MNNTIFSFAIAAICFSACAQNTSETDTIIKAPEVIQPISFNSFIEGHPDLEAKTDSVFNTMTEKAIIAQLLMPAAGRLGKSEERIDFLVENGYVGGMILLNGTKDQFSNWVKKYEGINSEKGNLPFLYSADAEPSLVNRKILNSTTVKKANQVGSVNEAHDVAETISSDLNEIGINYNFAPVVDMSPNKTVGYRGFGSDPKNIVPYSNAFIQTTQEHNIIATAKHFPGHGLVSGDTHKSLQVIDGELKELGYYPPLIENGVASIMVAHIAVKNNKQFDTDGMPATCSKEIVTDLLRDSLGFQGLIVTDAMGMGGVSSIPNSSVLAIDAGCDILLMPKDAVKAHEEISKAYRTNEAFKLKVDTAAKRIIRMKICLGLIK